MPETIDLGLWEAASTQPAESIDLDAWTAAAASPTQPAYTPLDTAATEDQIHRTVETAAYDNERIKEIGKGLTLWDQHLQQIAPAKKPFSEWTAEDQVNQIGAFMVSKGLRIDRDSYSGERATEVLRAADTAYTRFMVDSGLKDVASKEEGLQMRHAFLFTEMARRSALSPAEYEQAGELGVDRAIDAQLQALGGSAQPGLDYPKRFEALSRLRAASPEIKRVLARTAMFRSGDKLNDLEEGIYTYEATVGKERESVDKRDAELYRELGSHMKGDVVRALFDDMKTAWGTDNPAQVLANSVRDTLDAYHLKDLGFIKGDVSKPGVLMVDPKGFTPVQLLSDTTLANLEQKARQRGLVAGRLEDPRVKLLAEAESRLSEFARRSAPEVETMTPEAAAQIGPTTNALLAVGDVLSRIQVGATKLLLEGDRLAGKAIETYLPDTAEVARMTINGIAGNPRLARDIKTPVQALATVFDLATETGTFLSGLTSAAGVAVEAVKTGGRFLTHSGAEPSLEVDAMIAGGLPQAMENLKRVWTGSAPRMETPSEVDGEAFKNADPALLLTALAETNKAANLVRKGAAEAEADQEARAARMAKPGAMRNDPFGYVKDVAATIGYQLGASAREVFAAVVDSPEQLPLVLGGEKLGDLTFSAIGRARQSVLRNFYNAAKLREAGVVLGRMLPGKLNEVMDDLKIQIGKAENHAQATEALSRATAAAEALASDVRDGVAKGAIDPASGKVRLFSKGLADVLRLPGIEAPRAIQSIIEHLNYDTGTLEIANLVRSARTLRGKLSNRLSLRLHDATTKAAQEVTAKNAAHLLGHASEPEAYVKLQAEYDAAVAAGDNAGAAKLAERLVGYQSPNGRGAQGPIDALVLANTRDRLQDELRSAVEEATKTAKTQAGQGGDAARAANALARERVSVITRRINEIEVQLTKAPKLEALDLAQLMVAKDTGKLRYSFWTEAVGAMHNTISRIFGTNEFAALRQAATAADRQLSFDASRVEDWATAKMQQSVVKLRNDKLYKVRTRELLNQADALDALRAREQANIFKATTPEAVEEGWARVKEMNEQIRALKEQVAGLNEERRTLMNLPDGARWDYRATLLGKTTPVDELAAIVRVYEDHFDFPDVAKIGMSNGPEAIETRNTLALLHKAVADRTDELAGAETELAAATKALEGVVPPPKPPSTKAPLKLAAADEATGVAPPGGSAKADDLATRAHHRHYLRRDTAQARVDVIKANIANMRREITQLERYGAKLRRDDMRAVVRLHQRLSYRGAPAELQRTADLLRADGASAARMAAAGLNHNPWLSGTLPLHMKGRALGETLRNIRNHSDVSAYILSGLSDELNSMDPALRPLVGRAIAEGKIPDNLRQVAPRLAWELDKLTPDGRATFLSNLDNYLRYEHGVQQELLEDAYAVGLIDKGEYANMRRAGYDPGVYNWYDAPAAVTSRRLDQLKAARPSAGKPGPSGFLDGDELRFARDQHRYRVRAKAPDGAVVDRLFENEAAANRFVKERYGVEDLTRSGGLRAAKTKNGTQITIGDPIGNDTLRVLGFDPNAAAERRLYRFKQLHQDIAIHRFLDSLRGVGGMVLTPEEFHTTATRLGRSSSDFEHQYMRLPEHRRDKFGTMAGMYVHRKVLTEMNAARHSFNALQGWMESMSEFYSDFSRMAPKLFGHIPVMGAKMTEAWFQAVKFSQIIMSPRTWFGNMTFNIFADQFVGGRVVAPENWDNLIAAFDLMTAAKNSPRKLLGRDLIHFNEAVRVGAINGSVFSSDASQGIRAAHLRAIGLDKLEKVQARLKQLQALKAEEAAALTGRGGRSPERLEEISLLIASHEEVLAEMQTGFMKDLGRELRGMFFNAKSARGLPLSRVGSGLRESYGMIDDVYRLAAFMNLRRSGMSAVEAGQRILDFAQNYGNIPAGVSTLARSPFGALVPAFPMELTRLVKNYAVKQPLKLAAMLSIIPAINAVSAGMAGISMSRLSASMRAGGATTSAEATNYFATKLIVPNAATHSIDSTIDLASSFMPVGQAFSDYGVLSQAAETWLPEKYDGFVANAARTAAKFGGAFVLNNPIVNGAAGLLFNKDIVTGRTLVGEGASTGEALHAMHKLFTQALVPAWTPVVGRAAADAQEALTAPLHPETGRPVGAQDLGAVISRGFTGITVKGKLAGGAPLMGDQGILSSLMYAAEKSAGTLYTKDLAVFGPDADKRRFAAMLASDNPNRRAEAEAEIRKLAREQKTFTVNGVPYSKVGTEREEERYIAAVLKRGVTDHFNRLDLRLQTAVLIEADRAQVNDTTLKNLVEAASLDERWREQVPKDPEQVTQAIRMIDEWAGQPGASGSAVRWRDWLRRVQAMSVGTYEREKVRAGVKEQMRAGGAIR